MQVARRHGKNAGDIWGRIKNLIGERSSQAGQSLLQKTMLSDTPARALLHRLTPNFDRVMAGSTNPAFIRDALAALSLSAAKGSGTAGRNAAIKSLRESAGFTPGSVAGGIAGGIAGYDSEAQNPFAGMATGALLGGAGGAAAGGGGLAALRGGRAATQHWAKRMRGLDELTSMGIIPKAWADSDAAMAFTEAKGLRDKWNAARRIVDEGDEAVVEILGTGGKKSPSFLTKEWPQAMNAAGIRHLDAGLIINPDIAQTLLRQGALRRIQREMPGLKSIRGEVLGQRQINIGNPKVVTDASQFREQLARKVRRRRGDVFSPRHTSDSLWSDLRYSKDNAPTLKRFKTTRRTGDELVDDLDDIEIEMTGMNEEQLRRYLTRAEDPGNKSIRHIWDPAEEAYQPGVGYPKFNFDLTSDIRPQLAQNPQISVGRL
jgi:hypothetical protein